MKMTEEGRIKIANAVRQILEAISEDPERERLAETPRRVAEMYEELFGGLRVDPAEELTVGFEEGHQEMVVIMTGKCELPARDVPFYSLCEHHLLPFHGVAHIGYIPKGRVVGISKLARVVETLARRPQLQERLTSQVADTIVRGLRPAGVGVVIEATHLCMSMRGVKKPHSSVVTSTMHGGKFASRRGGFRQSAARRAEFLSIIRRGQ
jgi:GTP cyclohydrolase I